MSQNNEIHAQPHADDKKYVVVLAHADGWGAVSANKVVRYIHNNFPELEIHLIVSKASKDKSGNIATGIDDLKIPRTIKETDLLAYFDEIDAMCSKRLTQQAFDAIATSNMPSEEKSRILFEAGMATGATSFDHDYLTFNQLAKEYCGDRKEYCDDRQAYYTKRGGPKGGEDAATIINSLETQYGKGPEVLLSVDTMAILPKDLLDKYQCFSAHPGPLDSIKVEGMQGTLRALANQVLYNKKGEILPSDYVLIPDTSPLLSALCDSSNMGIGSAYLKGTLFMQHPELDKGPPIAFSLSQIHANNSAYETRDMVYDALTDKMLELLPSLLNKEKRSELIKKAHEEKETIDGQPHTKIPPLDALTLDKWQSQCIGMADATKPWGVAVHQNKLIDPEYFKSQMQKFFPGSQEAFEELYEQHFSEHAIAMEKQHDEHLTDQWAQLYSGKPYANITRTIYDPKTQQPISKIEFRNDEQGQPHVIEVNTVTGNKKEVTEEYFRGEF